MKKAVYQIGKRLGAVLLCLMLGVGAAGGISLYSAEEVSAAEKVVNGWDAAHTHYYKNGAMVKGKQKIGSYWYYFSKKTGKVQKNKLITINKKTNKICYYDKNGHAVRGEVRIGKYYYYFGSNYAMAVKSLETVSTGGKKKICYYNKKGHRVKGLKKIGKYYYYFDSKTGAAKKGFQKITRNGKTYTCYFNGKGRMVTGDKDINSVWYTFDKSTGALEEVLIAHASGNEYGGGYHGKAGDQTGKEVSIRSWYNRPWNCVLRPKNAVMAEKIAFAMTRAAQNDNIGYDMGDRNTLYAYARKVGYDPGLVTSPCETDCSALVSLACMYAGISPAILQYSDGNSATTGILRSRLESTGKFKTYTSKSYIAKSSKLKRGDILLLEYGHTAVVLGNYKSIK